MEENFSCGARVCKAQGRVQRDLGEELKEDHWGCRGRKEGDMAPVEPEEEQDWPSKAFENSGLYPEFNGKPLVSFSKVATDSWRKSAWVLYGEKIEEEQEVKWMTREVAILEAGGRQQWFRSSGGDGTWWENLRQNKEVKSEELMMFGWGMWGRSFQGFKFGSVSLQSLHFSPLPLEHLVIQD